jgi:hypothetical protein
MLVSRKWAIRTSCQLFAQSQLNNP